MHHRLTRRGVETPNGWRVNLSLPLAPGSGLYRWRDGQRYMFPELVNPEAERRIVHAPYSPPPMREPEYIIVKAGL